MHAAILADMEQKRDEALMNCQKKQNLIYVFMTKRGRSNFIMFSRSLRFFSRCSCSSSSKIDHHETPRLLHGEKQFLNRIPLSSSQTHCSKFRLLTSSFNCQFIFLCSQRQATSFKSIRYVELDGKAKPLRWLLHEKA